MGGTDMATAQVRCRFGIFMEVTMTKAYPRVLSASSISSDKVVNPQGEHLGTIEDLMIDLNSGRVAYAVLSFGGLMGMGAKFFAIPWESLTVDTGDKSLILNVAKETLENAPGFDKDNWPDMTNPDWGSGIYSHYGVTPYWY
jgi:sporulation protein YlmC with PRC-barrel domain